MANYNIKPRASIDSYGGVLPYLDATTDKHNGLNGAKFSEYLELGLSLPKIADKFAVSVSAIKDWKRRLASSKEIT